MADEGSERKRKRRKRSRKSKEKDEDDEKGENKREKKTVDNEGDDDDDDDAEESHPTPEEETKIDEGPRGDKKGLEGAVSDDKAESTKNDVGDNNSKPKRKRKRKRKKATTEGATTDESTTKGQQEQQQDSVDRTVYVEGIPFDASEDDLRNFFSTNGVNDVLEMRLPRWQDSGRLRGYGHVLFESDASFEKALDQINGKTLGKRYLTIQRAKAPSGGGGGMVGTRTPQEQPEGCCTVFCKNLPYHAAEEDIQKVFGGFGKIVEGGVRIARNYNTRQSKGFAYIEFKNPEGAHAAVVAQQQKRQRLQVLGRTVFVDYDVGQMKLSYKTQEGRLWSKEYKR